MKPALGPLNLLYPMPVVLVGVHVDDKPNYSPVTYLGILDHNTISLGIAKSHATHAGINNHRGFSINIPSIDMVREVDYCGMVSGHNTDKSEVFTSFYGKQEAVPLIEECPINIECELKQVLELKDHDVFIGTIIETYGQETYLKSGAMDISKVQPLLFSMGGMGYWKVGERIGDAWSPGGILDWE